MVAGRGIGTLRVQVCTWLYEVPVQRMQVLVAEFFGPKKVSLSAMVEI